MKNYTMRLDHAPYTNKPFVTIFSSDDQVVWLKPEVETDLECERIMQGLTMFVREIVACHRSKANLPEDNS